MKYAFSVEVKPRIYSDNCASVRDSLADEFRKVSEKVSEKGKDKLKVKKINSTSWGAVFCKDTTVITVRSNTGKNGYVIEAETNCRKALLFDILNVFLFAGLVALTILFRVYGWLLVSIGWFVLCMFYSTHTYSKNRTRVKDTVESTLNNQKRIMENGEARPPQEAG